MFDGDLGLVDLHVVLGLAILGLALARTAWRVGTPLPPWDHRLTTVDRKVAHATEISLIATQYVVPLSGLWLITCRRRLGAPAAHRRSSRVLRRPRSSTSGLVLRRGLLARML